MQDDARPRKDSEGIYNVERGFMKEVLGSRWGPAAIRLRPRNYAPAISSAGIGIGTRKLLART